MSSLFFFFFRGLRLYQYNDGLYALLPFKLPFLAFGRGFKAKDALVKMVKDRLDTRLFE